MVKIKEVAERAGVSPTTARRAIRAPDKLAPSTLERVRQAIEELNYEPDKLARALRSGRSDTIGLFYPDYQEADSLASQNLSDTITQIEQGYPFTTFTELAERLDISQAVLAEVLGISSSTLQRRRGASFSMTESDRIYRIAQLVDLTERTVGDREDARRWLTEPNGQLGAVPLNLAKTTPGLEAVARYLSQIADGVYL